MEINLTQNDGTVCISIDLNVEEEKIFRDILKAAIFGKQIFQMTENESDVVEMSFSLLKAMKMLPDACQLNSKE